MNHDQILRFSFLGMPIRGQWVRLNQVLSDMQSRQQYPPSVAGLLAEMLAAVALLADGIKFNGSVALQSRGDGPLATAMAECRQRHLLRCIGRWDPDTSEEILREPASLHALLGSGQLAITLLPDTDSNPNATPYQGMVGLEQPDLARNLESYFQASEQLPTRLFLAHTRSQVTGMLLQRLPAADRATEIELDQYNAAWEEAQLLAATLQREELDALPPADLLRRLFPQHTLTLQPPRALSFACTCTREKTAWTLKALPREELLELLETEGRITVTCEICGAVYPYDAVDTHVLLEPEPPRLH